MKTLQEVATAVKTQIANDANTFVVKSQGAIEGIEMLVKAWEKETAPKAEAGEPATLEAEVKA